MPNLLQITTQGIQEKTACRRENVRIGGEIGEGIYFTQLFITQLVKPGFPDVYANEPCLTAKNQRFFAFCY